MSRRDRPATIPDLRDVKGWERLTHTKLNGRNVEPGTELSVQGIRGRVRFIELVHAPTGSWITVSEPAHRNFRSVSMDRIKTVHVKKKHRPRRSHSD